MIVGVILIFLMFASTLGYAIQSTLGDDPGNVNTGSGNVTYNGYEFSNYNGFWVLGNFVFKYNPEQVPDVGSDLKSAQEYQGKPLYIQSVDENARNEIQVNMGQIAQRVQDACLEGTQCASGLPIKSCSDNFITIKESQSNSIRQVDGCVYIEGKKEDLVKLADQFLFKILDIR